MFYSDRGLLYQTSAYHCPSATVHLGTCQVLPLVYLHKLHEQVQAFEVHHVHKGFIQKPILLGPAHSWYLGMDVGRPGVVHGEAALPPRMVDKLKGTPASHMDQDKPESKKGPHVLFASVGWEGGGKEEWFINYNPSGCEWGASCSEAMHRVLGENGVRDPPVSVFWGVSGAYLVLRFSGAVEYDNLPGDMAMHVELAIQKHKGLAWAAMGPAGEFMHAMHT